MKPKIRQVQKVVGRVGVIRYRSIKMTSQQKHSYDSMIDSLVKQNRLELLKALRDGVLDLATVYVAFSAQRLDELPTVETLRPLRPAWSAWCDGLEKMPSHVRLSEAYLKAHRQTLTQLIDVGGAKSSVADLPVLLRKLKRTYADRPTTFDHMRASSQAFARDLFESKYSTLYIDVCRVMPNSKKGRKHIGKPQMIADMFRWETVLDHEVMAIAWSMASTGMGPKEYHIDGWERGDGFLRVGGKKFITDDRRNRHIPDLGRCKEPTLSMDAFARRLKKQSKGEVKPYDFRRSFANWMEAAGITDTNQKLYLGHARANVTDGYRWHDAVRDLKADAAKLSAWLEAEIARARSAGDSVSNSANNPATAVLKLAV